MKFNIKDKIPMTPWQRLEQVIKWSGYSTNKFAQTIGLKRSENLYQIKRGSFGVSKELSSLITRKYPQINRSWLLTGDGEMMVGVSAAGIDPGMVIPYYNLDATQLNKGSNEKMSPLYNISLPVSADFAVQCLGNSMSPDIPNGATVVVKQIDVETVLPGLPYLVVTKEYSTIKIVRSYNQDNNKLILQPRNSVDFDEVTIDKQSIEKIYAVKAVVTMIG